MAPKHPKRPRDLNQWAKHMVDIATGEANEQKPSGDAQDGATQKGSSEQ
jgi:hypothetical protein